MERLPNLPIGQHYFKSIRHGGVRGYNFCVKFEYIMAKDIFHDNVRQALIKDGWSITEDPLHIDLASFRVGSFKKGLEMKM
jgi:XisH protein